MITEQQLIDAGYVKLEGRYAAVEYKLDGPNPITSTLVCPYCGSGIVLDRSYGEFITYQCGVIISYISKVLVITSKTSACDIMVAARIEEDTI